MESIKCKSIIKQIKNKSGETMMETVISIALFLIVMAAITGIVKTATGLNMEARDFSQKIEQAGAKVEADTGVDKGDGAMNFDFDGTTLSQPITIKSAEPFVYFEAKQ